MRIKCFESFVSKGNSILLVVDVQKSFRKFFTEMYLHELKKYCKEFSFVYQIFDNHVDGKVDTDYLYDEDDEVNSHHDIYNFPNQKDIIEKRYNYDVDANFYKKILDEETYNTIRNKEEDGSLKEGDIFETKEGTHIVHVNNNHIWFHIPKKLYDLFIENKNKTFYIVGGSDSECIQDVFIAAESLGANIKRDHRYIYSASHCPI